MDYCVFRLYGPLASWGEIAVGGERRSAAHPSKSAIIGLIAAALGIKRDDNEKQQKLAETLGYGVKLISPGIMIQDFHTAQVPSRDKKLRFYTRKDEMYLNPEKINTVLSRREYRCDALYIVSVWLKEKAIFSIEDVISALKKPVFHLYLGRKSCPPAMPLLPQKINAASLKDSLDSIVNDIGWGLSASSEKQKEYFEQYEKKIFEKGHITFYWEDCPYSGFESYLQKTVRYDQPISRERWQFARRDEFMAIVDTERGT